MRSPAEISFRLRQEVANLWLAYSRPELKNLNIPTPLAGLPHPAAVADQLRSTAYAGEILKLAQQILNHEIPALGLTIATGADIRWRKDYVSGLETPPDYFRRVPYLDAARTGDHKVIWEINRHQHLVILAQANLFRPQKEYIAEIHNEIESWIAANPFQHGINWASALEVGFRALSWIWIYHFAGEHFTPEFRGRFLSVLAQHGLHLEHNLSVYFSPNTHLLGEALALFALGHLMPQLPQASRWADIGSRIVREEMARQVLNDGAHFERSSYYHVYATDMFLLYAALAGLHPSDSASSNEHRAYVSALERMAEYLDSLAGPSQVLPLLGDDDGGRLFHPYGNRLTFSRGTMAACAVFFNRPDWLGSVEDLFPFAVWWIGPRALELVPAPHRDFASRLFPDVGIASMFTGELQVLFDGGPFGSGSAGHSHSDTLAVLVRRGNQEILIDPGTYTYVGDPGWRDRFRGSAFHNTVRINGKDQGTPATPFSWRNPPAALFGRFQPGEGDGGPQKTTADARCEYAGFRHSRQVVIENNNRISIVDEITGPPGTHPLEWFWHFGIPLPAAQRLMILDERLAIEWEEGGEYGWRSLALGIRQEAPVLRAFLTTALPLRCETIIQF